VLVTGSGGAWSIASDGTRARLGDYDELAWSPRGLFIAAATGDELRAIERDGTVRWPVQAPGPVEDLVWSPSGYRIAYRVGRQERVVAGDGTLDATLVDGVAGVDAAWRPGLGHELAIVRADDAVELWSVDEHERLWRLPPGSSPVRLLWQDEQRLIIARRNAIEMLDLGRPRQRFSVPIDGPLTTAALLSDQVAIGVGNRVLTVPLPLNDGRAKPRVRLTVDGAITDLVADPTARRLIVASAAADQWVFLTEQASGRVSAATVRGFSSVEGWEADPLASASMGDGRQVVLSNLQGRSGCLVMSGIDEFDRQCLYAPSRRRPQVTKPLLIGPVAQKSAAAAVEVYGETSAAVDRVTVSYTLDGSPSGQDAVLLRATDPAVLDRAGIAKPFGTFVAELPSQARNPIATAYDSAGRELASDGYAKIDPHAFIGTAGPGDLPEYNATPWAYADADVSPALGDGTTQNFRVSFTTSFRTGLIDSERRSYSVSASSTTPASGCVNGRDAGFAPTPAGSHVSTLLRLDNGEGAGTRWCAGRYRGTIKYYAPGVRAVVTRFAFAVAP